MPPTTMIRLFAFGGVLACVIMGIVYMDRGSSAQILFTSAAIQYGVALYSSYFLIARGRL